MPERAGQSGTCQGYPETDLPHEKLARETALHSSPRATIFLPPKHNLAQVGMFIFVDEQFLYPPCTARTRLNSGKNALPAIENSSLKIISAPVAANAWTAAKEPTPFTNLRMSPTKSHDSNLRVWKSFN